MNTLTKKAAKNLSRTDLLFAFSLLLATAFLMWRCKFGLAYDDEAFYLTIPYRLSRGDAMFLHEWHLSQMSGFLLYPFMLLFRSLTGSTQGVVLAFRRLYILACSLTALYSYLRLRKISPLGACAAALILLLYTPFGLNAPSYNSMGLLLMALATVSLATAEKEQRLLHGLCGFFFAAAVLCCPYLALVFLLYALLVGLRALLPAGEGSRPDILSPRRLLYILPGILVMAALFLLFVFSRVSPEKFLEALPLILSTDPEHDTSVGLGTKLLDYFAAFSRIQPHFLLYLALTAVLLVPGLILKKRRGAEYGRAFLLPICLLSLANVAETYFTRHYINFIAFPLQPLILSFMLLDSPSPQCRRLFKAMWVPGMLYSFCIHLSSNQAEYSICSAAYVALTGGIVIMGACLQSRYLEEKEKGGVRRLQGSVRPLYALTALALLAVLLGEAELRYSAVFKDQSKSQQTAYVDRGPQMGICANPTDADGYLIIYDLLCSALEQYRPNSIFVTAVPFVPSCYLAADADNASYSAWLHQGTSEELLRSYYALAPEKLPDMIFFFDSNEAEYIRWLYESEDYTRVDSGSDAQIYLRSSAAEK